MSPTHHSYPVDPLTRHPNRTQCLQAPFWHYYFSDAVSKGFQGLYDNDGGVLDVFEQFWVTVASRFKDNPAVLGYELLNEPWVGDFFSNRSQLLARNADTRNLVPMYCPFPCRRRTVVLHCSCCFCASMQRILLNSSTFCPPPLPRYQRLHNAIRRVDDNHIIFFEPTVSVALLSLALNCLLKA